MASVKVAVRVRPFNQREIDLNTKLIIQMRGKATGILNCKANARDENIRYKEFTFDHSYWSHDSKSENFACQEEVYKDLGTEVVDCAFEGYNACVFAYGQTGSGKTYTMMGSPDNQGLIPRICKALFERMAEDSKNGTTHRVEVSYLEIYQERVADLLQVQDNSTLKVREHPKRGPYVQGLTTCLVTRYDHIQECMNRGNSHRTTAATNMNDVSSRSHAIFTITFVQAGYTNGIPSETVSKIHLVDLAGSERADTTGATGERLKEGAHINKSLVTLGSVISSLAELSTENNGKRRSLFIPYRDSVLTWLLKDSLGGNSKTIMIATISPADCNYGESLSTLRYANRAKNIINKPTVNEDANVKLIRELRAEISKLKQLMFNEDSDMLARIHEKEAREKELTEEWTSKWREAQAILREQKALGLRKAGPGVVLDSDKPHLVAIEDDPLSTGVTLYQLKEGETTIGTEESDIMQDIILKGSGMEPQHCSIVFEEGVATLHPKPGAQIWLNNLLLESSARLTQGCIIFLGRAHVFRFNDPAEAAKLRKSDRIENVLRLSFLSRSTSELNVSVENLIPEETNRTAIENQRLTLAKKQEDLEKEQEEFERRRKTLEEAEARLEFERNVMQKEHAAQTRQLEEDWRNLTAQQQRREIELEEKESLLILKREELESERLKLVNGIFNQLSNIQEHKSTLINKLKETCQIVALNLNDFIFPSPQTKHLFKDLTDRSERSPLSEEDANCLVDLLCQIHSQADIQSLVNHHTKELAELQIELERRMQILIERRKAVEDLDRKIIGLVEEQIETNSGFKSHKMEELKVLKQSLSQRTEQELQEIEHRKQSLTLNLKKVNSAQSPDSCEVNYSSSLDRGTLSSDTYHTAASGCSTTMLCVEGVEHIMSDSGVELRHSPHQQEESDLSSTEDCKGVCSDTPSTTSSNELSSPVNRKRRKNHEALHRLSVRISQQKQLIMKNLDGNCPKPQLDSLISQLQGLQRQYLTLKIGSSSILSPAAEHPLQGTDSPSPIRPVHRGSTSALYTSPSEQSVPYTSNCVYRSMPSIPSASDNESMINITGYVLRGAGKQTHYEYEVKICTQLGERWSVLRRYSRFRDLHLAMKARYGEKVAKIWFPPRQIFSNSESVAQSRKKHLEIYLRRLIDECKNHPSCPLTYDSPISKATLIQFSPFFSRGLFENGKYGTS